MSDPIINKRGFLEISLTAAKDNPSLLARVQSQLAITDVSINHVTDTFRMYGHSSMFEPLEGHQMSRAYEWHLSPDGSVTYSLYTQ